MLNGVDVNGNSVLWGTSSLLSESVLWGTSTVNSNSVLWGTSVIWGTNTGSPDAEAGLVADAP